MSALRFANVEMNDAIRPKIRHDQKRFTMPEAKPKKKIAIITGASSGLGTEFALQVEKKFYLDEIWMVARRATPMREVSEKFLKSKGVIFTLDLTSKSDLIALERRIAEENPDIEILVNNAGQGKMGPFSKLGLEEQIKVIDLNVTALTFLSRVCIPYMKPGSHIVQVSSSLAFSPSPYYAVYAATKAYVLALGDALGYELKEYGIHVTTVCPGPVETEFFSEAQKNEFMKDKVGQAEPFNRSLNASARDVVAKALADLTKGKRRSIYGFSIRVFSALAHFAPTGLKLRVLAHRKAAD